jgi:hypothetical protein
MRKLAAVGRYTARKMAARTATLGPLVRGLVRLAQEHAA